MSFSLAPGLAWNNPIGWLFKGVVLLVRVVRGYYLLIVLLCVQYLARGLYGARGTDRIGVGI